MDDGRVNVKIGERISVSGERLAQESPDSQSASWLTA
jgi:hypothetical protein